MRKQSSKKHKSVNSLDIYDRGCLSPLEERDSHVKLNENVNNVNVSNTNSNASNIPNTNVNQKSKKKGIPKLNFIK